MSAVLPARRLRRRSGPAAGAGSGFDATPGALVAVCGLHGGAGTTTTTTALAGAAAARSPRGGVLAVEASGGGELAGRLGTESPWSLAHLTAVVAAGSVPDQTPYVERPDGLRVLAATQPDPDIVDRDVAAVLTEARRAHALVVCDVGAAGGTPAGRCLPLADAVLWVVRAERLDATAGRLAGVLGRTARRAPWGLVICAGRPRRGSLNAVRDDMRVCVALPDDPVGRQEAGDALVALVWRLLA